ncbi:MAG: OstA-like protein [Salibacteraceae bacterium]
MYLLRRICFLTLLACPLFIWSQGKPQEIELLHADKFTVDKYTPKGANKLKGNVRLKHQNALMFCDSALLFDNNSVKAEGHVKIVESDSLTLKGDSLFYNGNTRIARFRSNVIIDNGSSILKTNYLDYNRLTNVGTYYNGGEIDSRQEKIHLTSKKGTYFSDLKVFHYKTDVVMTHPDYVIYTDTMHYSSDLEKTWFYGPTDIEFDDRTIYCEYGWFDQLADRANFIRNAEILSSGQILRGDTIDYDQKNQIGISKCNVVLIDTGQMFEVNGDYAVYYELDSISYVWDNMLMKQDMGGDTFFLTADTLHSYIDTNHNRVVKTYHHTRFFKTDMQGKCDSLIYLTKDSIIHLYKDPILWSEDNQITADSIYMTMKHGTMDKMYMNRNAFIIAHEDSIFYNQIKGIRMVGIFKNSELNKVDVFGNGQTIYYPREEDQTLIGVNETKCTDMTISIDSSQIKKISFYDRPTAKLTPTDEMPAKGMQLEGFNWRSAERPLSVNDLILKAHTPIPPTKKAEANRGTKKPGQPGNAEGTTISQESTEKPVNTTPEIIEESSMSTPPADGEKGETDNPSKPSSNESEPAPSKPKNKGSKIKKK